MRILYHHRTLGDGAEGIHIHEMIAAFRKLGHHVDAFSLSSPRDKGRGDTGTVDAFRRLLPAGIAEPARVAMNLPEYLALRGSLKRFRPDVVYKRHALLDVGACLAANRQGVPLVLEVNTLYSLPVTRRFEPLRLVRLAERLEKLALRSASLVVAVSTPLRSHIDELAGPKIPVLVVPNGVNPELFDPSRVNGHEVRARYGLTDRFVVGWTGVLRRWHGIEVLLNALRWLPDAALLVVGDGLERAALERLAGTLGLTDRLHITGRVPHNEVPNHVAAFDAAVAADDGTGFASPMKVVEYMALACPVVVPRLPNFNDLVEDNKTALQFTPGNATHLAERLRELSASPRLRQRLGTAARQVVQDRLNWEANARAVVAALEGHRQLARRAS